MKEHLIRTISFVTWLVICTVIFHKLQIHATWPAYLVVIFFFNSHFDISNLKSIFGGGAMGLVLGYTFPTILGTLTPVMGPEYAFYALIAITLLIILGLGPVAHYLFNPVTFAYSLLALINIGEVQEQFFVWLTTHFIGGALCIGGIYGVVKMMNKYLINEEKEAA
ncbi:MAG TPA: hypothetical protein VJ916_02285 [Anaerovoracaceae bacterium]|nr:hypothetical protein [Anaerovoracaceae bacterium]